MPGFGHLIRQALLLPLFGASRNYWERRYRMGGDSGAGSGSDLPRFKSDVLNGFVRREEVESIIEFGCGDGGQLALADYPRYLGLDISKTAIARCGERFREDPGKSFLCYDPAAAVRIGNFLRADLTLSLDVIYHLVEDPIYECYLEDLFTASRRFVIVYSTDRDERTRSPHVRHRAFTADVRRRFPEFQLDRTMDNRVEDESLPKFFFYARRSE
jgi:hypothetical protein